MTAPSVLVNFRLEPSTPVRFHWTASDGTPIDGTYKAQILGIVIDGKTIAMDASAILEQVINDPMGGANDFLLTFTGMVGFPADHADRAVVEGIPADGTEIDYELVFVHVDSGKHAADSTYKISERPRGIARKLA